MPIDESADTPRPALDAAALERLRERYDPGPDPACWRCGGPMQPTGYSPGRRIYRWYCYRDGAVEGRDAGEPDVLALLAAYDAAAARADALAEQLERLRSVLVLHASPDLLAALHRAALAPGEGGPDGGR